MKKISRLVALFTLIGAFGAPIAAFAVDASCDYPGATGNQCIQSSVAGHCNVSGICQPDSTTGAGSANLQWATFYKDLITSFINEILVPILIAVSFIVFLYGVYKYFILGAASDEDRKSGRQFVLWGVIGFVIIGSLWGLVNIVKGTLIPATGVSNNAPPAPRI